RGPLLRARTDEGVERRAEHTAVGADVDDDKIGVGRQRVAVAGGEHRAIASHHRGGADGLLSRHRRRVKLSEIGERAVERSGRVEPDYADIRIARTRYNDVAGAAQTDT